MAAPHAILQEGLTLHAAGRLAEARDIYKRIVAREPRHFDALHMLGVIAQQTGELEVAAALIRRAIKAGPNVAAAHSNLAGVLVDLQRPDEALAAADRAIALEPGSADAYYNRGRALTALGHLDEALDSYDRAIALRPGFGEAYSNRGAALGRLERHTEALVSYDRALSLMPASAPVLINRAATLNELKRSEDALASCARALAIDPANHEALNNRGVALFDLQRQEDALASYGEALALKPGFPEAINNRGAALYELKRHRDAIAAYDEAIALRPDFAKAHMNRGVALLMLGELREGFEEYRWRWDVGRSRYSLPALACPPWEGEDLAGKSIVVHSEQGYGDSLQFIRFVEPLTRLAGKVTVLTNPPLVSLFRSIAGIEVTDAAQAGVCDYRVAMMCLPRLLGAALDTLSAKTPYLSANPAKIAPWAKRLALGGAGLRVGLVWAGDSRRHSPSANAIDRRRSVSLEQLAPLATVPGVRFISLQKGEPAAEARRPPRGMQLADFTDDLHDFDDTAALVAGLDLVITVDTAAAHLAGALGKPAWILSRYDGCWRWMDGREDSPWYPTARLFNQKAPGAWDEVIERVTGALAARAAS